MPSSLRTRGAWVEHLPQGSFLRDKVRVSRLIYVGSAALYLAFPRTAGSAHLEPLTVAVLALHAVLLSVSFVRGYGRIVNLANQALGGVIGAHLLYLTWLHGASASIVVAVLVFATTVAATLPYNFESPSRMLVFLSALLAGAIGVDVALGGSVRSAHVLVISLVALVAVFGVVAAMLRHAVPQPQRELDVEETPWLADTLTALPRRSAYVTQLDEHLRHAELSSTPVGVLLVDLDRFGRINQALGHAVGDRVLAAVAMTLQSCVRPTDVLARVGGDEFGVILSGAGSDAELQRVSRRMQDVLAAGILVGDEPVYCSASVGGSLHRPGLGAQTLLDEAHAALLRAKKAGPGGRAFDDHAARSGAGEDSLLEQELWQAIEREEMVVHFQPVVGADDHRVRGFEALVRWRHPRRGLLGPGRFVSLAEDTGLIVPLGRQVLVRACRAVATLRETQPDLWVAVNLSARQLAMPGFATDVRAILTEHGLPGAALRLEVTEKVLLSPEDDIASRALQVVRAAGVEVDLDDFGTGYSSLARLHTLPVDRIKIDRSFVARAPNDTRFLRAIHALAAAMDVSLTAEGVETREQLDVVTELGCDDVQGWLFARAMPLTDLERLMTDLAGGPLVAPLTHGGV